MRTQILSPVFKTQIQFFSLCFNIPSLLLSNDQTKTFSNEFYVLYWRENNPWIWGKYGASQAVECSSRAILGFLEPLTPQFPLRRIRTNKLKMLKTQNKQSSIQEKLTRDSGGQPKRRRTERLQGHLHQHRRAVPGIFSMSLNPISLPNGQMTKLKPLRKEFCCPLFQGKQSIDWGRTVPHKKWRALPYGRWARTSGNTETGLD